ncbi:MAG: alpha/beta hydrolase family protein [Gemmatimonadota bacterium]
MHTRSFAGLSVRSLVPLRSRIFSRPSILAGPLTLALVLVLGASEGVAGQAVTQERPALTPDDFGQWERLGGATLSADGEWLAASITRVNEENELRVRPISSPDSVIVIEYGSRPEFAANGRWLAYSIGLSEDAREKLKKQKKPVKNSVGLLDLRTGEVEEIEDVQSFEFSADGAFLSLKRYAPSGDREASGADLVVRDLASGTDINFGNVSESSWRDEDDTAVLAMIIDAEGMAGNGVQLYEAGTGRLRTLDSNEASYSGLTWREDSAALALLRTVDSDSDAERTWADTARVVLAFADLESSSAATFLYSSASGFPTDHRVVEWEALRWSDDGSAIFLGIQERTAKDACELVEMEKAESDDPDDPDAPEEDDVRGEGDDDGGADDEADDEACADEGDEKTTVEIWHAADVDIVPTQKVRADRDRQDNYLSAWYVADGTFVQIENDLTETVRLTEGQWTAVGIDQTPYEDDRMFGPVFNDLYVVDLRTGERHMALERIQYFMGMSPGARYLLWLEDDEYWTYDTETGERRGLTEGLSTSFVNLDDDHTVEQKPPYGVTGWLEDDAAVLLNDEHDIWRIAPDASAAARVTRGAESNVRHRRARTDGEFDADAIDPTEPMYFSIYDDWTEMWGYARSERLGEAPQTLVWEEARISRLVKADDAEVYAYRAENFETSPNYFVAHDAGLRNPRQITDTNPFQGDYAWGKAELLEFENTWGDELQGSLYYPANYEPGRQYPMIVYIYEIRSNAVRSYNVPSERSYYDFQGWVQDGYFVWQPDIVYRDRDPGVSAVASIVPSVEAVVQTGMVDPDRIGLIGHSWGGYQTTFVVTQTDIFAAGVAGAPLTNLFSMYLSVYWNSGGTDARIFEISQGRMEVPFWEDEDAYRRNSPVFHIANMNTPLLMAQGTEDGAVDFNQGVEFYNAARRERKDFVFLVYNDENHGFRKEENQLDYHGRIMEWFGHYLKGDPAPEWIESGVPYLEQPGGEKREGGR